MNRQPGPGVQLKRRPFITVGEGSRSPITIYSQLILIRIEECILDSVHLNRREVS
jgi:hypothetical protein